LPERGTLAPRADDGSGSRHSRALGALILTEAAQTLRNIVASGGSPLALLLAPIGFGSAIVAVVNAKGQRGQIEKAEAKRLLQEYDARFRRDATIALDDGIRAAKQDTVAALALQIKARLQTVRGQIQRLTEQAAKITETDEARARVVERRQRIDELRNEFARRVKSLAAPGKDALPHVAFDQAVASGAH
jgi:hypothetical protein